MFLFKSDEEIPQPRMFIWIWPAKTHSDLYQMAKKEKAKKATHPTVEIEPGIYSVQYHQHNRWTILICFILFMSCLKGVWWRYLSRRTLTTSTIVISELRRKSVRNGTPFSCSHVEKTKADISSRNILSK